MPTGSDHDREFWGSCWRSPLDDPRMADDAPWSWGYGAKETRTLRAGERIEGTYHVLSSTTEYCFQRGEYRFRRQYELAGREYEWQFTLDVPSYDREA